MSTQRGRIIYAVRSSSTLSVFLFFLAIRGRVRRVLRGFFGSWRGIRWAFGRARLEDDEKLKGIVVSITLAGLICLICSKRGM